MARIRQPNSAGMESFISPTSQVAHMLDVSVEVIKLSQIDASSELEELIHLSEAEIKSKAKEVEDLAMRNKATSGG